MYFTSSCFKSRNVNLKKDYQCECIDNFNKKMFKFYDSVEIAYLSLGNYLLKKIDEIEVAIKENKKDRQHPITIIEMDGIVVDETTFVKDCITLKKNDSDTDESWDIL